MFKLVVLLGLLGVALGAPSSDAVKFSSPSLDGRIVGGETTDISRHPYIVSLLQSNSHICGGALISNSLVITAGHCASPSGRYSIRAGSSIRNSGGQVIAVSRVIRHESYSASTTDYDISILELSAPVTIDHATPIRLAGEGSGPPAGSIATITGWGTLTEGGAAANVLQVVQVPVVSQANCRSAYGQSAITDRMFCAGFLGVGGKDACQGDSGGPVVVSGQLNGLVSWGAGCARPAYPGVYLRIPSVRAWIRSNTGI